MPKPRQFFLLWPLALVAMLRRSRTRNGAALGVLAIALVFTPWRMFSLGHNVSVRTAYFRTDTNADGLLLGCALALWLS